MKKNFNKTTATLLTSALVASLFAGAVPSEVMAATEHWNDASASSVESAAWESWKANWDAYSSNYENVSLTPGINETQLNFAWYSRTQGDAKVKFATRQDMSDAREFTGTQENAVMIYGEQYISNKVTVTDLQENTQYYYSVMKNGTWTEPEEYSTKSFTEFSFLYVGDPQIGASRSQTSAERTAEYEAALAQYEIDYAAYETALEEFHAALEAGTVSANDIPVEPVRPEELGKSDQLNGVNNIETTAEENLAARNDSYNWNKVLNLAVRNHANVSFMVSAGDQVNYAKNEREYAGYLGAEALASLPVATTIGNHDSGSNQYSLHYNNPNTFSAEQADYTTGKTAAGTDYYYTYGNVLFIIIDTNNMNCGTHANVIKKAISENLDAKWRVVMFHQDIYGSGKDHSDSDGMVLRTQLTPIFDENDIDVVLQGHDHTYSRTYQLLGDGEEHTAFNNSSPKDDEFRAQNNCYEIVSDTVTGTIVNPEGTVYLEANSATGSKFYELIASQQDFIAERSQTWTPSYSVIDVTENTFTVTPYDATTGTPMFGSSSYTIVKSEEAETAITGTDSYTKTLGDKAFTLDTTADSEGKVTYESDNEEVAIVSASGKVSLTGVGTATITVKVAATDTKKAAKKEIAITVKEAVKETVEPVIKEVIKEVEVEKEVIKEVEKEVVKEIKAQDIIVKTSLTKAYGAKAFNLNAKADGVLSYTSSDDKVATVDSEGNVTIKGTGMAVITVKAAATDKVQKAVKEVTITVTPKKQTATVSNKTKGRLKVSWKKDTKATGYEVVFATNKKFTKNVTTVTVKKNTKKSYTIKSLNAGKTYYVKVRSYKTVNKERIYGSYSDVKKVKVK